METKKEIANYCNTILYYFKKMFEVGGSYKEKETKEFFKIIKIKFPNKMEIVCPLNKAEYNYWRSIKPSIETGEQIK